MNDGGYIRLPDAITAANLQAIPGSPPLVFVFVGESNSGGIALNSAASASELAARPSVLIMDLYSGGLGFENLRIGYNNLVDHDGISTDSQYVPSVHDIKVHGMELGLAAAVEAGAFPGHSAVLLIKAGQGGSSISEWGEGGAYWTKFLRRINAAKLQLRDGARWIVWYSQGINDVSGSTLASNWLDDTAAHCARIKAALPGCQIVMTQFQSMGSNFDSLNTAIMDACDGHTDMCCVSTTGAALQDSHHWSYAGFKDTVVPAMVAATTIT